MFKRTEQILNFVVVPILAIGVGIFLYWAFFIPSLMQIFLPDGTKLIVEQASDPASQVRGLSGRDEMGKYNGMLFEYYESEIRTFWMKDMNFEIDMIWINNETIVGIDHSVPVLEDGEFTRRTSPSPINRVLEVNAGFSADHGLVVGDVLDIIYGK